MPPLFSSATLRRLSAAALFLSPLPVLADAIDDYVRAQMALNRIPGVAVAVVRDGRVEKLQGYGVANLEWRQAVDGDTMFQLASSTKPFTGLLLMRLAAQGLLDPDAPVGRYLPDAPPAWKDITLRHLADHSSGIPDNVPVKPEASLDDYVAAAAALPLAHAPGARPEYGIAGYIVLRRAIEKASGMPYAEALKRWVTAPLGLAARFDFAEGSGAMRSADVLDKRAAVYEWKDGRFRNFAFQFPQRGYSAGGLYASAADFAKLAQALDGGAFLRRDSLASMWRPQTLGNGERNGFAMGWTVRTVNGVETVGHSGGPALSDILHVPSQRLTIAVLINAQAMYPYLAQGIHALLVPPAAAARAPGIADTRPDVSAGLRAVLEEGRGDRVDPRRFAPAARESFLPGYRAFLLPYLRALPAPDSFVLIAETPLTAGTRRRYQALHGGREVTWQFDLDAEGRVLGFGAK